MKSMNRRDFMKGLAIAAPRHSPMGREKATSLREPSSTERLDHKDSSCS